MVEMSWIRFDGTIAYGVSATAANSVGVYGRSQSATDAGVWGDNVSGGGRLIIGSSAGAFRGKVGAKNNFGFSFALAMRS